MIKKNRKKLLYISLLFLIGLLFFGLINFSKIEENIVTKYPNLRFAKYLFKPNPLVNKITNDYNVKFLPNTEFVKLNFEKKINFKKQYYNPPKDESINYRQYGKFFIETYKKNFSRVINQEKVFLNERIRDLKYDFQNKLILLALEEKGELGILSLK